MSDAEFGLFETEDGRRVQEKSLAERMLHLSVSDYLIYGRDRDEFISACRWLFEEEKEDDFASFKKVCNVLEVNPEKIQFLVNCFKDRGKKFLKQFEFNQMLDICTEESTE